MSLLRTTLRTARPSLRAATLARTYVTPPPPSGSGLEPPHTPTGKQPDVGFNDPSTANYSYQYDGAKDKFKRTPEGNRNNVILALFIAAGAAAFYYWETIQLGVFGPVEPVAPVREVNIVTFEPTEVSGSIVDRPVQPRGAVKENKA